MSRDLAILALVTDAYGGQGGIAQYNRDLFDAIVARMQTSRIQIVTRLAPGALGRLPSGVNQGAPGKSRLSYVLEACRAAVRTPADIVFCGHLNLLPLAAFLARMLRSRLVLQLHGIEAWEPPSPSRRRAVESADLILCVSRYTRARLLSWAACPPERAVVIPNTVREAYHPATATSARGRFGLDEKKALLTVGRLDAAERYKGHDRIIERLADIRAQAGDVVYLIGGDGDDRPRLAALAVTQGVADHVRFLGQMPEEDLPDLYRAVDLFVLPSTGEGFGIVFLEAMACGTPALGLAEKGAVDALADGDLGAAVPETDLTGAIVARLRLGKPDAKVLHAAVIARFGRTVFTERVGVVFSQLANAA